MAQDLFADTDGEVAPEVIGCVVDTGQTVKVGDVVYASTHVAQELPKISVAGAANEPLGVVVALENNSGAAGKVVSVALVGSGRVVKCYASGAITVGKYCKTNANGKVQAWGGTPAVSDVQFTVGLALQTTTTDGDEFLVLLK